VCGAVMIARDPTINHKIMGLHVAGKFDIDGGYVETIPRELLEKHCDKRPLRQLENLDSYPFVSLPGSTEGDETIEREEVTVGEECSKYLSIFPYEKEEIPTICISGEQMFLGVASDGPHQSTLTKLRPTKLFDLVEQHKKEPAPLSAFDPRLKGEFSPLEMAFNKFAIKARDINPRFVDLIHESDSLYDIVNMPPTNEDVGIVTWPLVLQGRPEEDTNNVLYGPMNLSSSSGYPWNKFIQQMPGKTYYINNHDEQHWFIQEPMLKTAIRERIEHWLRRESYPSPWSGQLKDELRSTGKCENGETRLFTAGPIDFQIVARIFSIHWVAAVHQAVLAENSYSRVGIDMASYDTTKLIRKHLEVGENVIAGDHSDFDGQLSVPFTVSVFEEIADWCDHNNKGRDYSIPTFDIDGNEIEITITPEQFRNALYVCGSEVWSTTLLVGRNVFIKSGGNTSGNNLTVYINNKVNRKYILLCWYTFCFHYKRFEWLSRFDDLTRMSVYGDDILLSVSDEVLYLGFNFQYIQAVLAEYGLKFTDPDKSLTPPPYVPLLEATFLKRSFRKDEEHDDLYVPMMAHETIHELVNWYRKTSYKTEEECLYENIDNSLRFAVYHGKTYYNDWYSRINTALTSINLPPAKNIYFEERAIFLYKCGKYEKLTSHMAFPDIGTLLDDGRAAFEEEDALEF